MEKDKIKMLVFGAFVVGMVGGVFMSILYVYSLTGQTVVCQEKYQIDFAEGREQFYKELENIGYYEGFNNGLNSCIEKENKVLPFDSAPAGLSNMSPQEVIDTNSVMAYIVDNKWRMLFDTRCYYVDAFEVNERKGVFICPRTEKTYMQ